MPAKETKQKLSVNELNQMAISRLKDSSSSQGSFDMTSSFLRAAGNIFIT